MKSFLLKILKHSSVALVLMATTVGPFQPLIVQAATDTPGPTLEQAGLATGPTVEQAGLVTTGPTPEQAGLTLNANGTSVTSAQQAAAAQQQGGKLPTSNCALGSGGSLASGGDWAQCITDVIYVFTIGIGSGFAYVSAYFFDWAISLSLNGSAYALDFVSQGWTTARDIANMAFLFILLFIAFKIMFEAETSETVHMLVLVIVIALLVNFSFFFTRLAIDAGNILSIQFYNAIDAPSVGATAASSGVQSGVANFTTGAIGNAGTSGLVNGFTNSVGTGFSNSKDLTASIMGMLNLQGLLSNNSFQAWRGSENYGFLSALITLSFLYISAAIMLWILTVAFITNGVKFLFRIVILWFLIIASPLAFVARAVPKFKGYYDQWQDALIKHAFYPVAFMFIFLILTNFSKAMGQNNQLINGIFTGLSGTNGSTSAVATIGYAVANIAIRMGFVIAMLYIGMEAAKKIGVMGASAANHAGNWVGGKMIGTYGAVGRNTAGWVGNRAAATTTLRNLEARSGPLGLFGRGLRGGLSSVGRASFDARGLPGAAGSSVLKGTGKAQDGGYEKDLKNRIERMEKQGKALEPTAGQKAVAQEQAEKEKGYTLDEAKKTNEAAKKDLGAAQKRVNDLKGKESTEEGKEAESNLKKAEGSAKVAFGRMTLLEELAKKKSGEGAGKVYADTLTKPNIRNLWNLGIGPWRARNEAATKIRKGKSKAEKVLEEATHALHEAEAEEKKAKGDEEDDHGGGGHAAAPAVAPTKPTPPAGGGGGHGGGGGGGGAHH
jgi:hypothetical protein